MHNYVKILFADYLQQYRETFNEDKFKKTLSELCSEARRQLTKTNPNLTFNIPLKSPHINRLANKKRKNQTNTDETFFSPTRKQQCTSSQQVQTQIQQQTNYQLQELVLNQPVQQYRDNQNPYMNNTYQKILSENNVYANTNHHQLENANNNMMNSNSEIEISSAQAHQQLKYKGFNPIYYNMD